jgi:hypothetical protein
MTVHDISITSKRAQCCTFRNNVGSSHAWEISRLHTVNLSIHGERAKVNFSVCGDSGVKLKGHLAGSVPTRREGRSQYDKT